MAFIFLALPTGGSIWTKALPGLLRPTAQTRFTLGYTLGEANGFNIVWVSALNRRKEHGLTHFVMHHGDVAAPVMFADLLRGEQERVGADIVSACISIKDHRGLTSTGVRDLNTGHIRRLTRPELKKLPPTFRIDDIPWADPQKQCLVVNNGLWICRFTEKWVEEVTFRFHMANIALDDGRYQSVFYSEDWEFSEWAHRRGLKVYATHAFNVLHKGGREYGTEPEEGDNEVDPGDSPLV